MQSFMWRFALGASLLTLSLQAIATQTINSRPPSFAVSEHVTLGNEILLRFDAHDPGQPNVTLHLPNRAELTFGEAISMGDFYAVIGKPVSKGDTEADRKARFIAAFNLFATTPAAVNEMYKIRNIIKQEITIVDERMKNGELPEAIYKSINDEMSRQFNCVTGGGCEEGTWWTKPGKYLNVASDNFDHFGDNAIIAYQTGHQAALEQALIAHQTNNRAQLELAYAMTGFASHYLTDRFSAGHIRTPRNELAAYVTPDLAGSLLAGYMHGEESAAGLHVHNVHDDHWIAYGDWSYFNNNNEQARIILHTVLQASVDEIYTTYLYGAIDQQSHVEDYIPIPDELNAQGNYDISPMFYWDATANKLMRRTVLSDPYDRHWTDNWWGWSTLAELREERGEVGFVSMVS